MNVDEISRVYQAEGPFVSLYMTTEGATEGAAQRVDLLWKNLRKDLSEQGADDASLGAIEEHVPGAHTRGDTLAAIAARGSLLYVGNLPEPPKRDIARVSALPYGAPLIEWSQTIVPHVVLVADRRGADILTFLDWAMEAETSVDGDDDLPITKSAPGGWSQRRYQQRAENAWDSHAHVVAEKLSRIVDSTGARLVVATGDVRALQLLHGAVPERVASLLKVIEGGSRSPDGSVDMTADLAVKEVATVVASDTVALLEKFAEERGQHDRAADGADATLDALSRAQVATLLVHDDPNDHRAAFFGPDAIPVATEAATLKALGIDDVREGRLVDVAIRAAFGTRAVVRIIPSTGRNAPHDGIGAILRFAT